MKYKLQIRRIEESDVNVNCPFMPQHEDFEMHLNALVEDIESIDVVVSTNLIFESIEIELESESDFNKMHSSIKNLLLNSYNDKLRTVNGFSTVK